MYLHDMEESESGLDIISMSMTSERYVELPVPPTDWSSHLFPLIFAALISIAQGVHKQI